MTIIDGSFDPDTKEQILDALVAGAEDAFDEELDPDQASVIRGFYETVAQYMASQQEDIAQVLTASQIDNAEGQALDLLAALVGVTRLQPQPAETTLQFSRNSRTLTDYTVPEGSKAQTDEADPVVFATDNPATIKFIDGFEDNDINEYTGDKTTFSTTTTSYDGSYGLRAASSTGKIIAVDDTVTPGSVMHVRQYLNAGAVAGTLFAVGDANNYYSAIVDSSADEVRLEKTDGGSTSTVGSAAAVTVPTGSWIDFEIQWGADDTVTLVLRNSSGSELVSHTVEDSNDPRGKGGIGFESLDSTAAKHWDNFTMSAVGAVATATSDGADTNVGANTVTILSSSISGVDSVTNPVGGDGGRDEEQDDTYRERAKRELSEGMRASLPALISQIRNVEGVNSITIIDNDTNSSDADGRPGHSFEAIVGAPSESYDAVAEAILETKAAGDTSVGGYDGTAVTRTLELVNGQTKDITFSKPTTVQIYVDCDLTKTESYAGDEAVQDHIVQYIGGVLSSGDDTSGELDAGDDVVYNQMVEAIMDVEGVYDITNLEFDNTTSPTGTSNYTIAASEVATADATDGSLDINSSDA